jgi:hypothetical protein
MKNTGKKNRGAVVHAVSTPMKKRLRLLDQGHLMKTRKKERKRSQITFCIMDWTKLTVTKLRLLNLSPNWKVEMFPVHRKKNFS